MLFHTRLQKLPEVPGWSLEDRWGDVTALAPGRKATSSLSFPLAQITPPSYTKFITNPFPSPAYRATPGTVSIRTHMVEKMPLVKVYASPLGFPACHGGKDSASQCRRCQRRGFHPWVRNIPWRRTWQPTPALLPGESHGQRSLVGYSLWGPKESDTTEADSIHISVPYELPTYYTILLNYD